jgi:hypothetical protein
VLGDKQLTFDRIILDDCDRDTYGLQQATQLLKDILENNLTDLFDRKNGIWCIFL